MTPIMIVMGGIYLVGIIKLKPRKNYEKQMGHLTKMKGKGTSLSHGSAEFAGTRDLKSAGLLQEHGRILGKFGDKFIRHDIPGHLITFAPTRSGKGVGHVIPNLLDHPGSVYVNDIKGENFAVTGRYRKNFGKVVSFAPFENESSCYNPIDYIRVGTDYELEDAQFMGEMLILEEGKDPFWEMEAKNLVVSLLLFVAVHHPPALRNMGEVRYLLMQSRRDFDYTIKEMQDSPNPRVRSRGASISATEPKVLASVMSVAKAQTAIWDSPRLQAITSRSDFQPGDLKTEVVSFYLVIPPDRLAQYASLVRLMTGIFLSSFTSTKGKPDIPVIFLIDEFPALGYMRLIEEGVGYLAGYGAYLWMFIQDLSQLKANYEKWETFISNCSVRMAFGTNDNETAKTLSEMLGATTIVTESGGTSSDGSMKIFGGKSKSTNVSETQRNLMTPDEVMRMPGDTQLIFVQGEKPIVAEKVRYYADPYFAGKFDEWEG